MNVIHLPANNLADLGQAHVHRAWSKSTPGKAHFVLKFEDFTICTCEGFQFAQKCWHVNEVEGLDE